MKNVTKLREFYSVLKKLFLANRRSLTLFVAIGTLTAVFYASFFTLLYKKFHLHYQIAISISYIVSVILYYLGNRKFTFKNSRNTTSQQLPRYLTLLGINYLVTLIVMHASVELLSLPPVLGLFAAISTTFMLSYTLSRFWIFKNA